MSACVAVIDPAISSPATTGFNEMAMLSPLPLTHHLPFLHGITSLLSLDQDKIAGVVVLGSNSSINSPFPHQELFTAWLHRFCERQRPLLGICYGHQLLASVFGGKVAFMHPDRKKISGLRNIEVLGDERLGLATRQQELVVSHNEIVTTIPAGFEVFARSQNVPYEGLRHRELPIWTMQAHVEATQEFLNSQSINMILPAAVKVQGFALVAAFLAHCNKI